MLGIVSVFLSFKGIKDKRATRCIHYLEENVIELFIILSKILGFFIYKRPKIIEYCLSFIINKKARLLV